MKSIILNGWTFEVRENLFNALSHLQSDTVHAEPRVLWIDAICIDQSNTEERNHQVSLMGKIYSQARKVVVWLGLPDNSCFTALEFLQSTAVDKLQPSALRELFLKQSPILFAGIYSLSANEYWKRLWVIQEFLLASKVIIQCGSYTFPWRRLRAVSINPSMWKPMTSGYTIKLSMWNLLSYFTSVRQLEQAAVRAAELEGSRMVVLMSHDRVQLGGTGIELGSLFVAHQSGECENELDKVFGVWALAKECCQLAVPIDYSLTLNQVKQKLFEHDNEAHFWSHIKDPKRRDILNG